MNMFDPTSLTMIVILSLPMPVVSFMAYVVLFRQFKNSPYASHKLIRTKTRVLYSLISGVGITFCFYLITVITLWEYASVVSLSGVLVRMLIFAGLCSAGIYIGAAIASRVFGPKDS